MGFRDTSAQDRLIDQGAGRRKRLLVLAIGVIFVSARKFIEGHLARGEEAAAA